MDLSPSAWSNGGVRCTNRSMSTRTQASAGVDGRDLVQVTVSEFWTCGDSPDKKY